MKKSYFSFNELTICVNHALINGKFPSILKNADIHKKCTPVHKKDDPSDKTILWPVSVLSLLFCLYLSVWTNYL